MTTTHTSVTDAEAARKQIEALLFAYRHAAAGTERQLAHDAVVKAFTDLAQSRQPSSEAEQQRDERADVLYPLPKRSSCDAPDLHLFEFWWAEYMPEATQARAWEAWQAAPRADGVGVKTSSGPSSEAVELPLDNTFWELVYQCTSQSGNEPSQRACNALEEYVKDLIYTKANKATKTGDCAVCTLGIPGACYCATAAIKAAHPPTVAGSEAVDLLDADCRKAYDSHFRGTIAGIPYETWEMIWQKAIASVAQCAPTLAAPVTLDASVGAAQACCGEYATCHQPCTPRGRWQAAQNQNILPDWVGVPVKPNYKIALLLTGYDLADVGLSPNDRVEIETREAREWGNLIAAAHPQPAAPAGPTKLWLWKNFVNGKPEYWAFDNPFPINLDNGDPQTLGEPCGYALVKPSRQGRTDVSEEQVLRNIARAAAPVDGQGEVVKRSVRNRCPRCVGLSCLCDGACATPTPSVDAEMVKDAENFRWLCEDIENPAERYDRNRLLECMSVVSYSSMRLAIDAIRHAHKDAAIAAHKGMSHG